MEVTKDVMGGEAIVEAEVDVGEGDEGAGGEAVAAGDLERRFFSLLLSRDTESIGSLFFYAHTPHAAGGSSLEPWYRTRIGPTRTAFSTCQILAWERDPFQNTAVLYCIAWSVCMF